VPVVITENVKHFWDAISNRPDWVQYILPKRTDKEFEQEGRLQANDILKLFPLNGGTVIEYGCGIGRISKYMSQHANRMVGLDICEAFLKKAREQDTSSEYILSDVFREKSVADFVYSVSVMQHNTFKNAQKAMTSILRMLKQGGTCLITFAHGPVYGESAFIHKYSEDEVKALSSEFSEVTIIKSNLVRYAGYTIPDNEKNELILLAKKTGKGALS
jgi:ubiquinone/menaquinone biosynthesis C-methylase UbiE